MIRNSQEEKLFKANVDFANWTEDALYALAGRPTGQVDLVSEHHAKLHRALLSATGQFATAAGIWRVSIRNGQERLLLTTEQEHRA